MDFEKIDSQIDWEKVNGLIPVVVQSANDGVVLMLGYMNKEALAKTLEIKKVTFFSRTKNRLWTKGESSGNFLFLQEFFLDCDNDTILIKAISSGPTCHLGGRSCFSKGYESYPFLSQLENIVDNRLAGNDEKSYVKSLQKLGQNKIVQKVGEEAVEFVIAHLKEGDGRLKDEAADLLFHLLVALRTKNIKLEEIIEVLKKRHK